MNTLKDAQVAYYAAFAEYVAASASASALSLDAEIANNAVSAKVNARAAIFAKRNAALKIETKTLHAAVTAKLLLNAAEMEAAK